MATRSIVAEVTPTGWRGRYCHWDGHPATKVDQLLLLVARDGVETVTRTLIQDHYSWSVIDPFTIYETDAVGKWVEGYGWAHNDIEEDEAAKYTFTHEDTDFAWTEYLYVFGEKGLQVWTAEKNGDANTWTTDKDSFHPYLDGTVLEGIAFVEKVRNA